MAVWLDFFLQVFVQALAWCVAAALIFGPSAFAVLVGFQRWRRASRAVGK